MPTTLAPEQQAALLETFCAGVRALGLAGEKSIGAAKGDIKLTAKGPMIGEIAARLSGGYMSGWTYPYSSGVQPIRAAILAAMGRRPDGLAPAKTWTSAERAFISIPGTVKAITGTETARDNPLVKDLFLRIARGSKVGFPENNVSKCGNIISAAGDRVAAIEAAEGAVREILIQLDPEDQETAVFLGIGDRGSGKTGIGDRGSGIGDRGSGIRDQGSGNGEWGMRSGKRRSGNDIASDLNSDNSTNSIQSSIFPPDAFQLDPKLRSTLLSLPETMFATANGDAPHTLLSPPQSLFPIPQSPVPNPRSLSLISFPEFINSGLKDYVGRGVAETLSAVRKLTGLPLPEIHTKGIESSDNKYSFLGKSFWAALVRGGYQGAVYYIERLRGVN
jgi:hypothetical protein